MIKDFERLPEVAKILKGLHHTIIWFGGDGLYHTSFNLTDEVCFLNGALYAYQEQQKQIQYWKDEYLKTCSEVGGLKSRIDDLEGETEILKAGEDY